MVSKSPTLIGNTARLYTNQKWSLDPYPPHSLSLRPSLSPHLPPLPHPSTLLLIDDLVRGTDGSHNVSTEDDPTPAPT
jgi:hypothetical protein